MNDDVEKRTRSGAQTKSAEEEVKKEEEIVSENVIKNIKPLEDNKIEKNIGNNKKEKKKINKRILAFIVVAIVTITATILLVILKVNSLKEKYKLPEKEVTTVFESKDKKKDDDLQYVVDYDYLYDKNDINIEKIYYVDGNEISENDTANVYNLDYDSNVYREYYRISGLKNKDVENHINNTLKNTIMDINCTKDNKVKVYSYISGNFGDVVSITIHTYDDSLPEQNKNVYRGINLNLNTGEQIKFEDLFISSAPIASMLLEASLKKQAWNHGLDYNNYTDGGEFHKDMANQYDMNNRDFSAEEDYGIEVANLYKKMQGNIEFSFGTNSVQIYNFNPSFIVNDTGRSMTIDFSKYKDYVAIYKRFKSSNSIYENDINLNNIFAYSYISNDSKNTKNYYYNDGNVFVYLVEYTGDKIDPFTFDEITKRIIEPVKKVANEDQNKRYCITGTINLSDYSEYVNNYESDYKTKNNYLYKNGVRKAIRAELSIERMDNVDNKKFGNALSIITTLPRASIGVYGFSVLNSNGFMSANINSINFPNVENINNMFKINDNFSENSFYYDENKNYITCDADLPSIEEMKNYLNQLGIDSRS